MRPAMLLEAVLAVALGAGGGAGFLFGTGDLRTPAQIDVLQTELDSTRRAVTERKEAVRRAEQARLEAEEKARLAAEAAALREAEEKARLAAEEAARKEAEAKANRMPAFGLLSIKAAADLNVDAGEVSDRGKSVELPFENKPGKIKVKGGRFTIYLTPRVQGSRLKLDVSVSPMAIIVADGERKGVSTAQGLVVGRGPFKLDFQSPAAGDLNLVLQYRK